jgi:hypothetical protein
MDSNYTITALLPTSDTEQQALVTTSNAISSNASIGSGEASDILSVINITCRVLILYIISTVTEDDSVNVACITSIIPLCYPVSALATSMGSLEVS